MKKSLNIKLWWIIIIIIILCLIIVTTSVLLPASDPGIQKISIQEKTSDKITLNIGYFDCKGYAVKQVYEDEIVYVGEQPKKLCDLYDGFGKYFIKITLGDVKMSKAIQAKYNSCTPYTLSYTDGDISFLYSYKDDSGVCLFFASNDSMHIEEKKFHDLIMPFGTIKIDINVDD